ncbi:hypothetical protein AMK59_3076 [Oryctes borbonicus]|uniref:Uncharacterized protein n=1 Tax=Oryctes borbonicus TaxID=1629725 RepID=A0A0T6B6M2_9SCAR|nr:hypothetical protein AMK59_3076 [Oryctes borbonicus]
MPEVSLNLLKEKIIKTDTVIRLLVDKNEKILQLREKLKMLYHKYVNKVKEYEVLQVRIDLCKIEHEPLLANIKDLTTRYESLVEDHQSLINSSEVKYQSKCKELELQTKKYEDLSQREEICSACVDTNIKYESLLRNHNKLTNRLETLNSKQRDDRQTIQDLQNHIDEIKSSYCNQIKILKQNNVGEIAKLEGVITGFKLSESKLKEEILDITSRSCNVIDMTLRLYSTENAPNINDLAVQNSSDESDEEFNHVLDMLSYEDIPMIFSPLSDSSEENGNEHMNEPEVETMFASDDEPIDNNFTHTIDNNTAQTFVEHSVKSYDQCIENYGESNKAFQDDATDVQYCSNREIMESITNNLMDNNEKHIDLSSDNLNDCSYTCTTENTYEDVYFGSLKNINVEPAYIFENESKENAIDLIIQCFDDTSDDLTTNLTENNDCRTVVSNQYSENPHNFIQNKSIVYIPKCTTATDLIGFLKECDIIDKINNTMIKTYSKCFIATEKSVTKDSKSVNSSFQESVIGNYPSYTRDSLACITSHNEHMYPEHESFQSGNIEGCTRNVCIDNLQSNLNNSQHSVKIPTAKWNEEVNITLKDQISANNAVLISSIKKDCKDNNETNIISLGSVDEVVANTCEQVNNSIAQNESPVLAASADTIVPLERKLLTYSDTVTSLNNEKIAISSQCQQTIVKISGEPIETINKIITDEQQRNCCASEVARDDNSPCARNKCHRETAQKITVRTAKKRNMFNKMKAELFTAVVGYLNKRLNLKQILKGKKQKHHSLHFKRIRRLQMLRWKQLREMCPSSTDTDSEHSKKLRCVNRRFKCKSQSEKETLDETNEKLLQSNEERLEMSDEEVFLREIIKKEEINNQKLLASHKQLEEFYYMSIDGIKMDESKPKIRTPKFKSSLLSINDLEESINKEECYSADSGYVKSDSDECNSRKSCKRKRDENPERSLNKKIVFIKYFDNEENCIKQDNINLNNTLNRKEGNILPEMNGIITNQIGTESTVTCLDLNSTKFPKEIVTTEICSLLDRLESKVDEFEDDPIILPKPHCNSKSDIDCSYLFGSDCESISSEDERNGTPNSYLLKPKDPSSHTTIDQNKQCSNEKSITKSNTSPSRKRTKSRIWRSVCDKSEPTSKIDSTSTVEDPLRARLWQDCLSSIVDVTKKSVAARPSYKRSNSLKNCKKLSKELTRPGELCQIAFSSNIEKENTFHTDKSNETFNHILAISDKRDNVVDQIKGLKKIYGIPEKRTVLNEEKARSLIKQLLTFPDKLSIVMETATAFATQDNNYIIRMILLETSFDTNKADTKYTPPAPVLTDTQRILLGFLMHLNRTVKPGVLDDFIVEAEKHIFTSTKLQNMENVTRLYLAVCKLQRKIHRMRRMVCDVFYFMGDLSIPFLFTVLSTWIEVIPLESELNGELIVKVIIEIIKQKTCVSPGYNLVPLKGVLKAYYGYNMDENILDDVFLEIFNKYKDTHSRVLEYAILLFCKNLKKDWVEQKIKQYFEPLIENISDSILKENVLRIIKQTTQDHTFEGDGG